MNSFHENRSSCSEKRNTSHLKENISHENRDTCSEKEETSRILKEWQFQEGGLDFAYAETPSRKGLSLWKRLFRA
jgi:hypothetical protein